MFAAYKVEHPLFANFVLRLQTEDGYTPREALQNACAGLISELDAIKSKFSDEWQLKAILNSNEDDFDYQVKWNKTKKEKIVITKF